MAVYIRSSTIKVTLRIKLGTQGLRCSNLQGDFVLLRIFYEGVACTIKS